MVSVEPLGDGIVREYEAVSRPPTDFGPIQLANLLGLAEWQFEAAASAASSPGQT